MSELLPCPFCGSTELTEGVAYPHGSSAKEPAMMCNDCSCRALKTDWQKRPAMPQGEPVAWENLATRPFAPFSSVTGDKRVADDWIKAKAMVRPLYASPSLPASEPGVSEALQLFLTVFQKRVDETKANIEKYGWEKGGSAWDRAFGELAGLHFCIGAVAAAMKDSTSPSNGEAQS